MVYIDGSISIFEPDLNTLILFRLCSARTQDILNKRNPRLVPYVLLDERTKKTNRDSVNNAVRTLIGYGYNIEPPDQESSTYARTPKLHIIIPRDSINSYKYELYSYQ